MLQQVHDAIHGDLRGLEQGVAAAQDVLHVKQDLPLFICQLLPPSLSNPGLHLVLDPLPQQRAQVQYDGEQRAEMSGDAAASKMLLDPGNMRARTLCSTQHR